MDGSEPHLDIQRIQELVIDERYREAFESLPSTVKMVALNVAGQVRTAMGDIFETDRDRYKGEIIDALSANQIQHAATLLAAHPDNVQVTAPPPPKAAPRAVPTAAAEPRTENKPPPKKQIPPYFPFAERERDVRGVEGEMIFPVPCERLADEVFRGSDPRLTAWLMHMEHDLQVPSSPGNFDLLIEQKALRTKRAAERKLESRPPLPLNHEESNAQYHPKQYFAALKARALERLQKKSFSHLLEYVVVELLHQIKDRMNPKLKRVLKSSPEEDLFCRSDLVVEDERGRFWSVDLTVSQHEGILDEKAARSRYHQFVELPNLKAMLVAEDEIEPHENLNAVPIVQQMDRDLVRMVTQEHMESIKSGKNKPLTEIFRDVAARLGKNDDQASHGLLNLAA